MDRNTRILVGCLGLVAFMVGMSYAAVPLYRIYCQLTGFDGTPLRAEAAPGASTGRKVTVRFDANISQNLAWEFRPAHAVTVETGEQGVVHYTAKSLSDAKTAGMASFNVTPEKAAPYFNKVACFCFERQELKPHEAVEMGVSFFVDPKISEDPTLDDIDTITLSYTFYPAKDQPDEVAALNDGTSTTAPNQGKN
jgi:cytochrome c oxidase assembly protein subunit 11